MDTLDNNGKLETMKRLNFLLIILCCNAPSIAQDTATRLLVRADDMGASRSANFAAIEAYEKGIVRSVEVMVPGAWFEEAATLLNDRPDLDVGIHLTLTSEWSGVKWRPLTSCASITDESGYFFPFVWKNEQMPHADNIVESAWNIDEIENELRAQIELGLKRIPHITHLSEHMGCLSFSDATKALLPKLAEAYGLSVKLEGVSRFPAWSGSSVSAKDKVANLLRELDQLPAGTHLLVEHPAFDDLETRGFGHVGYENVAEDRAGVLMALTDPSVQQKIAERGIQLISYKHLKESSRPATLAQDTIARTEGNTGRQSRPPVKWVNPEISLSAGLTHYVLPSDAMGHEVGFTVWTPEGYEEATSQRYSVIYFLHGMGGSESSDAAGFSSWLAQAIETGALPPVICVFPNGGRSGYRGAVEKMIVDELIPHIDNQFRTVADGAHRGVAGFSMGGAGAVYLSIKHPELFGVAGSMGGGIRMENEGLKQQAMQVLPVWKKRNMGFIMVNGDNDRPHAFDEFSGMLRGAGVAHQLLVLEDTGHNLGHYYERSVSQLLSFIGEYLGN